MRVDNCPYYHNRECIAATVRLLAFIIVCLFSSHIGNSRSIEEVIVEVYAGEDTQICGGSLSLDHLGAYIRGDVRDGDWTTSGTGYFISTGNDTERFSASSSYIPSNLDISAGHFTLRLTADDPNPNNQRNAVFDEIRIDIIDSAPMVCRSHLNLTQDEFCEQEISPSLYLINPPYPDDHYTVSLFTEDGTPLDSNVVTGYHAGMTLDVKVALNCNGNSCWGKLTVDDKNPPPLYCSDITVSCLDQVLPDSVGFPLLQNAFDSLVLEEDVYRFFGLDNCTDAYLSFHDVVNDNGCVDNIIDVIQRTWSAEDGHGNKATCQQEISIKNTRLMMIEMPLHFDGDTIPVFVCSDTFPLTDLGHPSPDTTGYPFVSHCTNLQTVYNDYVFPICGSAYKVVREWTIVDWCTGVNVIHNQNIHIVDTIAPIVTCVDDMYISTGVNDCESEPTQIALPVSFDNCSSFITSLEVRDTLTNNTVSTSLSANNVAIDVDPLPIGVYSGELIVIDECGNRSSCIFLLMVEDNIAPIAVCDLNTEVGLQEDGHTFIHASSIDDGSVDNCSISRFGIKRIDLNCETIDTFSESVMFCCEDLDTLQEVMFRVWDAHDNYNDCTVRVNVVDHIVPKLYCPNDVTISCEARIDTSDLSSFGVIRENLDDVDSLYIWNGTSSVYIGLDGLVIDNCGLGSITEDVVVDLSCSTGSIDRIFTVMDHTDRTRKCTQRLTIANENVFSLEHISWPENIAISDCGLTIEDIGDIPEPQFTSDECGMVTSTFHDLDVTVADSSCYKILREWNVIDWCQYDEDGTGLWSHYQEIKILNTVAPIISEACRDTVVCVIDGSCTIHFHLDMTGTDDCSLSSDLTWRWELDLMADEIFEDSGDRNNISEYLPIGDHTLVWKAYDGCRNMSSCEHHIEVVDCKPPTIYCQSEISTSYMPASGMVTIVAEQFDIGSEDNCSDADDLIFSFSEDITDTSRDIFCADIPSGVSHIFDLQIWVTDVDGNQDFCEVTLHVRDTDFHCPDSEVSTVTIEGNVYTPTGENLQTGVLELHSVSTDQYAYADLGEASYAFNGLPIEKEYKLDYEADLSIRDGISVLDLVAVQNHILQLKEFTNVYQHHAADANGSKTISATDLVILRKVILGFIDTFPEQEEWQEFSMNQSQDEIWGMKSEVSIPVLTSDMDMDITIVKTGDVNFSNANYNIQHVERRNALPSRFINMHRQEDQRTVLSLGSELDLQGVQFTLEYQGNILHLSQSIEIEHPLVTEQHYNLLYDEARNVTQLRFCWHALDGKSHALSKLLSFPDGNDMEWVMPEDGVYLIDDLDGNIYLGQEEVISHNQLEIKVQPNPVIEDVNIYFSTTNREGSLSIIDALGQVVYSKKLTSDEVNTPVIVDNKYCKLPGIYYIKFQGIGDPIIQTFIKL